ncbi:hypothetical protein P3W45_000481 [Vairimorpha bombi]|jgi:STE24 endopeptidase
MKAMKNKIKAIFYIAFGITIIVLLYEGVSLLLFRTDLNNGELGVPKDSATYKLASESKIYRKSMMNACNSRISTLKDKLLVISLYTLIGCLILFDTTRLWIFNLCKKPINFYYKTVRNISKEQVAFTNIFVFIFLTLCLDDYLDKYLSIGKLSILPKIGMYIFLYSVFCPIVVITMFILLRMFGAQLILAFYISLILKNFYEIFIENDMSSTLKKIPAETFSEPVQARLEETHLEDKVFEDTDPTKETNAALVGVEKDARIEIYGDFDKLPEDQKDSVLLHEIGHAIDHSLLKKLCIYFSIYYFELLVILFLHNQASHNFKCENISRDSIFILLSIVYFLSMRDWMLIFYKMSSQRAEIAADLLAKESGFAKELANSLFMISVTESSYIKPTWLYNALYAMHPSIYNRVEYLYK